MMNINFLYTHNEHLKATLLLRLY